jgi:DNA-binding transcriptional LysR family regulator
VVDDLSTIAMVANGFGICIMPELVMNDIPYQVQSYPVESEAHRMIGLASLNPQLMAPAVRTLYQHILNHYTNIK